MIGYKVRTGTSRHNNKVTCQFPFPKSPALCDAIRTQDHICSLYKCLTYKGPFASNPLTIEQWAAYNSNHHGNTFCYSCHKATLSQGSADNPNTFYIYVIAIPYDAHSLQNYEERRSYCSGGQYYNHNSVLQSMLLKTLGLGKLATISQKIFF